MILEVDIVFLFEVPQFFYRIDNYLMHMGLYPDACKRLSEALCSFYLPALVRRVRTLTEALRR